ncbi:hypothetical protein ACFW9N_37185 [Streptomyces sp. NPDC059496]|uniref:hypothetical protein n=1 Tax=Streptomyces sp. NPDC059496 TaxID=3346851 RepID=UPI0036991F69
MGDDRFCQSLALGPLLGLSQSLVLRKVTGRWKWWIGANLASWLIVDIILLLLSRLSGTVGQQVDRTASLDVHQDRGVDMALAQSELIHSQHAGRRRRGLGQASYQP